MLSALGSNQIKIDDMKAFKQKKADVVFNKARENSKKYVDPRWQQQLFKAIIDGDYSKCQSLLQFK